MRSLDNNSVHIVATALRTPIGRFRMFGRGTDRGGETLGVAEQMFLRRALRYRWSQALVLAGVSLLIGTCAVFAPWFARAVEQTVMTETLTGQRLSAAWQLETSPTRSSATTQSQPEDLSQLVPADVKPLFTPPVLGIHSDVGWHDAPIVSRLLWRDGYCAQLVVVAGRCPQGPNEVIASTVDQTTWDVKLGTTVKVAPDTDADGGGTLTVVGLYRPKDAGADYWFGRPPTGHSKPPDRQATGRDGLSADRP